MRAREKELREQESAAGENFATKNAALFENHWVFVLKNMSFVLKNMVMMVHDDL